MTYTVKTLIEELKKLPQNSKVYFWNDDDQAWNNHGIIINGISEYCKDYPDIVGIASNPYQEDEHQIHI